MRKKIILFLIVTLAGFLRPPTPAFAWTEELMQSRCVAFVGNPAAESNKVYVATVNGEKSTYYRMKFDPNCQKGDASDAISNGYNDMTREVYGDLVIHRPAYSKFSTMKGNRGKARSRFEIRLNTTACGQNSEGHPIGMWCEVNKNFWWGGRVDGGEYRYIGYSNTGTEIENPSYPVDIICSGSTYDSCLPKGYAWRPTAWDSGNIDKTDYDSASTGSPLYKIKYETVRRFLAQEGMGSNVGYYFNRFSLKNDGEMEAGILAGSSGGNRYNIVVAAAPKTASRNMKLVSVKIVGAPQYVKGNTQYTVEVVVKNEGDLVVNKNHTINLSYGSMNKSISWSGPIGAYSSQTLTTTITTPNSNGNMTLKASLGTNYTSYNQWTNDDSASWTTYVDASAPTNSVSLSRDNAWGNTNVTATLYAGDSGSGLASQQYAMWDNNTNAVVKGWTNYSNNEQTTISREGITRIQTWSKDKAGNETYGASKYIKIDKTNPTGSISVNTENWQNTNSVTATLYAGDGLSGVKSAQYRLTGATSTGWIEYSNGQQITISNEGTTKIEIWVQDQAGNAVYPDTKHIRIDRTNPTGSISANESWQNVSSVTATLYAGDATSGVKSAQYRLTGATSTGWIEYSNGQQITISNEGTTKIEIWVQDQTGNAIYADTKYVRLDRTAPTGGVVVNTENWQNAASVTATLNAGDSLSGVRSAQYRLTGATTKDWTNYSNGTQITISNQGETTIEIKVTDNVGLTYTLSKKVRLDRTAPTGGIAVSHENWQNATAVKGTLTVGDSLSGVKSALYQLTGATAQGWMNYSNGTQITISNQGETTITIKVTDNVGLTHTTSKTVRLDRNAPSLSTTQNPASWTNQNVVVTAKATDNFSLWSLNAYERTIGRDHYFSATQTKSAGKILVIMNNAAATHGGFDGQFNNFTNQLKTLGFSVTTMKEAAFTSLSQTNGYDAIFYLGWYWSIPEATAMILNAAYEKGIALFTNGNNAHSMTTIIQNTTYTSGSYTISKTSNNHLGELVHNGKGSDEGGYSKITPISGAKVLATATHEDGTTTPYVLHYTNSNSTQWIHHQGEDLTSEFVNSAAVMLLQRQSALTTSLTHNFTVTENGTYPVTVYDLAGNRTTVTHVVNTIDRHNPTGSVVIDQGQDFLNNEETTLHLTFNDIVSGNNAASGVHTVRVFDVNGTYSKTFTDLSGTSMSIPWVLVPWEAPDGALKAQVGVEITDRAGNRITVYSQVVDIIKVYVTKFQLLNVLNPAVYNKNHPFTVLTYPNIPAQPLVSGAHFTYYFEYYHPKNVNSQWKIDYISNARYQKPNGKEEVIPIKELKQSVTGDHQFQHIIPYDLPVGTKVYLDLQLVLYDASGRKVAEGYFPQPMNTSLYLGEIKGDIRNLLQFNEVH